MEIYQKYVAKDGRMFDDALKCQEYEKTLGVVNGSVGDLIVTLENNTKRETYIFGIVKVKEGDKRYIFIRATICVDDMLKDFVNVEELTREQRYRVSTAGELTDTLKELDPDSPCQFFIIFSDDIDLNKAGAMSSYNKKAWNEESKR